MKIQYSPIPNQNPNLNISYQSSIHGVKDQTTNIAPNQSTFQARKESEIQNQTLDLNNPLNLQPLILNDEDKKRVKRKFKTLIQSRYMDD